MNLREFQWWSLVMAVVIAINPRSRAIAAVLVGKCLSPDLAKHAIPLVLHPVGSFWPVRTRRRGLDPGKMFNNSERRPASTVS